MPELPEVNTFRKYLEEAALNQKIAAVEVFDDKIIRNMSGGQFVERMVHRTFVDTYRRGKYLFVALDNQHDLLLHFGMTGDLNYYEDLNDKSRFERFVFHFDNGFHLGFDCPRKFARILYLEDRQAYIEEIGLAEDALEIDEAGFLGCMQGKKGTLKGFLLNQKNVAGVGNLYADEICYQTRIHPASRMDKIPLPKKKDIFREMQRIIQYAVDRNAYYKEYPEDWLWQWREAGAKAPDGSPIQQAKIGGRTTYFFEGWQQLF